MGDEVDLDFPEGLDALRARLDDIDERVTELERVVRMWDD